jgi:hypothetical protein
VSGWHLNRTHQDASAIAGNEDRARSQSAKTARPRSVFTRAALDSSIATSGGQG